MLRKGELEMVLSRLREPPSPKPGLEQYTVPSELAAEILNLAYLSGDIKGKVIFDLGCGSARLSIGASLLGAKEVIAIDVDRSVLRLAKENVRALSDRMAMSLGPIRFVCCDIRDWFGRCDTVIQNPPFGIQNAHADRAFLVKALECGKRIYSLHRGGYAKTRAFLTKLIQQEGGRILQIRELKFVLPHTFKFHKKPRVSYDVDLYVIEKIS
jgi:putative methylase